MKRRLPALLATAVMAIGFAVLVPATSASASVCVLGGSAWVSPGLLYPIGGPLVEKVGNQLRVRWNNQHVVASFAYSTDIVGGCGPGLAGLSASGTVQGYCGHSTGTGTAGPHLLAWTGAGGFLILTHGVTGIAYASPDILGGQSCFHGANVLTTIGPSLPAGATRFIVAGVVRLANCETFENLVTTLTGLPAPVDGNTGVLTSIPHIELPVVGLVDNLHLFLPPLVHTHQSWHTCVGSSLPL